jgi:hypothetical protein
MSFYFTNPLWLALAVPVLIAVWPWRKVKPRRFVIGGFFDEKQRVTQSSSHSAWPTWWIALVCCCCLTIVALSQPHLTDVTTEQSELPTPFIVSAAPLTATVARAQIIDDRGALSLREIDINQDGTIELANASHAWHRYKFADVQIYIPAAGVHWKKLFVATWPLAVINDAKVFSITIDGSAFQPPKGFDIRDAVSPENSAAVIHDLRAAVNDLQPWRDYAPLLDADTVDGLAPTITLTRWLALAAAGCALLSLLLFKRTVA